MNRTDEWDQFVQEVKNHIPPELAFSAEKAVGRLKRKSRAGLWVKIPVAGVFVAAVALTAVCNSSERFAKAAGKNTLLRGLSRALTLNPSLRAITAGGTK